MPVLAPKHTPELTVVKSSYLHDDGTAKTIAEILGKAKDEKSELQDFSQAVQSRVKIQGNNIILKISEEVERMLSRSNVGQELSFQSGSSLSKQDIIAFIQEAFGKNDMPEGNENFFMRGGKDDATGREVVAFFHSVVGLDSGKHYWLGEKGQALCIDTTAEMMYIVKLDSQSKAYNL